MKGFPKALTRLPSTFIHIGAVPASFLVGALIYEPKALGLLMQAGEGIASISNLHSFNVVICAAIILFVTAIARMTLWLIRKRFPSNLWRYFFWCIGEVLLSCAFTGLYLILMDVGRDGAFFHYFGGSISSIGSIIFFPYLILALLYMALAEPDASPADGMRLKFYDNRHQLKFITEAGAVLFIESNENYIIVHYMENGIEKKVQIRNSMKNIEPLCEQAGFARTHRCYIVNPLHIKSIRKENGGINFAELAGGPSEGIPISKKYYDSITSLL